MITFQDVRQNEEINTYLKKGNEVLFAKGITEHSLIHANKVSHSAGEILKALGYEDRKIELAKIAGYMHDIGNTINRDDHAQSGGIISFFLLNKMGMEPQEIACIASAIGNHDEGSGSAFDEISAALILADKSDVRRTRVRNRESLDFDIHDRVNYAVTESEVIVDTQKQKITLNLSIDQSICPVIDYFEIFTGRMIMCRRAADRLNYKFGLVINDNRLL